MIVPKKAGIVLVMMGAVLILSALLLFLYNRYEDDRAGREARDILEDVQSVIAQREEAAPEVTIPNKPDPEAAQPPEMTVVMIDGYEYIGYLTIPALELELPVMAGWDYDRLQLAPCRQFGSAVTDDLVIAAHNYKKHFAYLYQLADGDSVVFTDMNGSETPYTVTKVETIDPKAVEAVQNSGHDLVLYTCTYGGATRVAAFCDREMDEVSG